MFFFFLFFLCSCFLFSLSSYPFGLLLGPQGLGLKGGALSQSVTWMSHVTPHMTKSRLHMDLQLCLLIMLDLCSGSKPIAIFGGSRENMQEIHATAICVDRKTNVLTP